MSYHINKDPSQAASASVRAVQVKFVLNNAMALCAILQVRIHIRDVLSARTGITYKTPHHKTRNTRAQLGHEDDPPEEG